MEEYKICQGIREGRISKPVVSWCIGTCATMFSSEVWRELPLSHRHCPPHKESWLTSNAATCRYSSAMQGPVPTRLQKQRWPRTRPCGTPGPTCRRALTSLVTSLGETVKSENWRFFVCIFLYPTLLVCVGLAYRTVYDEMVANGTIVPAQEVPPPTVPMDYSWARVTTKQLHFYLLAFPLLHLFYLSLRKQNFFILNLHLG